MKIKKSTIVWFVLAIVFIAGIFMYTEGEGPEWSDATYVKDAKVDPENEGKLVAISGYPVVLENAKDDLIGVSFDSPLVRRYVDKLTWDRINEEWKEKAVKAGTSDDGYENGILTGLISIGEFEIDPELMTRLSVLNREVKEDDFSAEDIAHMNDTGYISNETTTLYYRTSAVLFKETYQVRWKMWEPKEDQGLTVVGVQKGNTLTYEPLNASCSEDKFMDEEAFNERTGGSSVNPRYISAIMALIFILLGVRSMRKAGKKKE